MTPPKWRAPSTVVLWISGALLLWLLYAFVFVQTADLRLGEAGALALANVLPLALLAIAVRATLINHVMSLANPVQALAHGALAIGFAITWYATVLVLLAFVHGVGGGGFAINGFAGPAFTWQVFQGLILYALVAAVCYAVRGGREAAVVSFVQKGAPLDRYLTKAGDEFKPVEVGEIVTITGAQDYSEVVTTDGARHLVRMSLSEFGEKLDDTCFIRVHRSAIINLARLDRLESAGGGRMTAHMAGGESVNVSRTGVQLLRPFIV